jgi:hypothetical protein
MRLERRARDETAAMFQLSVEVYISASDDGSVAVCTVALALESEILWARRGEPTFI